MITITSDVLQAQINPFGAELQSLTDAEGREYMSDGDPAFWRGRAPLLFPIVGRLNDDMLRIDRRSYRMEKHGFARRSAFDVVHHDASRALFQLSASAETRDQYPFDFLLNVDFRIDGAGLTMTATVHNNGQVPLPASFGFHPAFAWPLPDGGARDAHRIVFEHAEAASLARVTPEGLIDPALRPSPLAGNTLTLADSLFVDDALVWRDPVSRRLTYASPDGPALDIAFPDTAHLGIWTKPGARFVCVEPWAGQADPEGFTGDFRTKPAVFAVMPGGEARFRMIVSVRH